MMVYVDMDGVLVDFHKGVCKVFGIKEEDFLDAWRIHEYDMKPALRRMSYKLSDRGIWARIQNTPNFWEDLEPLPWFESLLEMLDDKFADWMICTSPAHEDTNCASGKHRWLQSHFGCDFKEYIFTPRKHILSEDGAILIDDTPKNVHEFNLKKGKAFCFPRKWNTAIKEESKDPVHLIKCYLEGLTLENS